jgi:hypothetical protein
MRSVGGVGIGIVASLCGCATAPPAGPAPPPIRAPAAGTLEAGTPVSSPLIEWNTRAGTIRCRPTKFEVPEPLRAQVRQSAPNELTIVPSGSPPGGALIVRLLSAVDDQSQFAFLEDFPSMFVRLHLLATGGTRPPENADMKADGGSLEHTRLVVEYTLENRRGKMIYFQAGGCRFAALDYPSPGAKPVLTLLLEGLNADYDYANEPD